MSVFLGPVLLAGELGREEMPDKVVGDNGAFLKLPAVAVPDIASSSINPADWLRPIANEKSAFTGHDAGAASGITFRPLYEVHHQRYSVDWRLREPVGSGAAADAPASPPAEVPLAGQLTTDQKSPRRPSFVRVDDELFDR